MKKFLFIFTLFYSCFAFSQNIKSDIERQFKNYNLLIEKKEFKKALEIYGNEEFFKIVPIEQMVQLMNQMFNSPNFEFKIYKPENIVVSNDIVEEKNNSFVKVNFQQSLDMKFKSADMSSDQMLSALQAEFGYEAVKFNEENKFFEIKTQKEAVANSADLKNWKFAVIEKKQIPLLKQFIPETFLKGLK